MLYYVFKYWYYLWKQIFLCGRLTFNGVSFHQM